MTENTQKSDDTTTNNDKEKPAPKPPPAPVVTEHESAVAGKTLAYTATAGMLPLKNEENDEIEAHIFFVAYTLKDVPEVSQRPLAFVFNGGPGSSSVWLHMGAVGPQRVKMHDEGWMPAPPYELQPNEHSWLDVADLVFIDPVGTGYSRATKSDHNSKFWSVQGDLVSLAEFIRLYLTRYQRWSSPLFVAGESYGTTRAAGLANELFKKGIALNGIVLISTILNFQTARFTRGNDLPYHLFLPTYAVTARYHNQLPPDLQEMPLEEFLTEVQQWAENDYLLALARGDRLSKAERAVILERLSAYTGLSQEYLDAANLRVQIMRFCKQLLREQRRTVGRLDSRFTGRDAQAVNEFPEFDPSMVAIAPPYTAMFNDYVRGTLGYETDREYAILSYTVNQSWEWDKGQFADTSELLRSALAKNPYMQIFVAQGYYDLATPYFAADYTLTHMEIAPELRDNIQRANYGAGHMFYLDVTSLAQFKSDTAAFIERALSTGEDA